MLEGSLPFPVYTTSGLLWTVIGSLQVCGTNYRDGFTYDEQPNTTNARRLNCVADERQASRLGVTGIVDLENWTTR